MQIFNRDLFSRSFGENLLFLLLVASPSEDRSQSTSFPVITPSEGYVEFSFASRQNWLLGSHNGHNWADLRNGKGEQEGKKK